MQSSRISNLHTLYSGSSSVARGGNLTALAAPGRVSTVAFKRHTLDRHSSTSTILSLM